MIRQIIHIDEDRCTGCGLCANACHEGALAIVNGKAKLIRDDYCDGMGDCLPACPADALTFETREATPYSEAAVQARKAAGKPAPGSASQAKAPQAVHSAPSSASACPLENWPVQMRLVPVSAPWYAHKELLLAADCTAFACPDFHERYTRGRATVVACPKLDPDFSQKLAAIVRENSITGILVARMEVPCCGGIERAAQAAAASCGRDMPVLVRVIKSDGSLLAERAPASPAPQRGLNASPLMSLRKKA